MSLFIINKAPHLFISLILVTLFCGTDVMGITGNSLTGQTPLKTQEKKFNKTQTSESNSTYHQDSTLVRDLNSLDLARNIKCKSCEASSLALIGRTYLRLSDLPLAEDNLQKALKLYQKLDHKTGVIDALIKLSKVELAQGTYDEALKYSHLALTESEKTENRNAQARIFNDMGEIYLERKENKKALFYFHEALNINEELMNKEGLAKNFANIGILNETEGRYDQAIKAHMMALELNIKSKNSGFVEQNMSNMGKVFSSKGDFTEALDYQYRALDMSKVLRNKVSVAMNYGNIGKTYFKMAEAGKGNVSRDLDSSISNLKNAISILRQINHPGPLVEFTSNLSKALYLTGDYKKAFEALSFHHQINDSLFSEKTRINIADLEKKRQFELDQKDLTLKAGQMLISGLEKKSRRNGLLAGLFALCLSAIIIIVAFRYFLRRIAMQKIVLNEIIYIQSHKFRGPVARIMGLSQLLNTEDPSDPVNQQVVSHIYESTLQLDQVIRNVVKKANQ